MLTHPAARGAGSPARATSREFPRFASVVLTHRTAASPAPGVSQSASQSASQCASHAASCGTSTPHVSGVQAISPVVALAGRGWAPDPRGVCGRGCP
eukprot:scaffold29513_cov51-Phaeocystis_antarctica.AAC.3